MKANTRVREKMEVNIRHSPSAAVARCHLRTGETLKAEAGAMAAHSFGIEIESNLNGGLGSALKRSFLGGDSLFVSTFKGSPHHATWVDLVPPIPGDMFEIDVNDTQTVILMNSAWIANSETVRMETKWGGAKTLVNGNMGFSSQFSGIGKVVGNAFGAIDAHYLEEGEGLTIDTGHLVGYTAGVRMQVRKASRGLFNTMKSGEGIVVDAFGPGVVFTQSRNINGFLGVIINALPNK